MDEALSKAKNEFNSGNYEKSLELLNAIRLNADEPNIQRYILIAEDLIALSVSEDSIHNTITSVYMVNPKFDPKSQNIDISDALLRRINSIVVYPKFIFSLEAPLNYILPLVKKQPYVCAECVSKDNYEYKSFGEGIDIRLTFMKNKMFGGETGIGFTTARYQRNIKNIADESTYSLQFSEKLQLINIPLKTVWILKKWTYKAGLNYKYLIKSNITGILSNTSILGERQQTAYTRNNGETLRNRNLFFLSAEINRTLFQMKNKRWYITTGSELQVGLNTLTDKKYRLSDINFVSNTNYTDDLVHLCFISINLGLHFEAHHYIK